MGKGSKSPPAAASGQQDAVGSFKRRDFLLGVEATMQKLWEEQKVYEIDAAADDPRESYMCTFPYPYMNGRLHLGHAFTLTKAEFAARFQRLLGKAVLFPFGLHCTGMPIAACADKLKLELSSKNSAPAPVQTTVEEPAKIEVPADVSKFAGKKSKAVAKKGGKTQFETLVMCGVAEEEIPKFADSGYWLQYFPPRAVEDLKFFGASVDWRRSFITTDRNKYYDAFVQWQFRTLYARDKIKFGTRPAVFSYLDQQPCADHDRKSGEGAGPQEYTAVKMEVQQLPSVMSEAVQGRRVYLLAATLRPETMYGQTNCFVLPTGDYGLYIGFAEKKTVVDKTQSKNGVMYYSLSRADALAQCTEVYVCSAAAALNMAYQGILPLDGDACTTAADMRPHCLTKVKGAQLIGVPLSAPNATYRTVYALPMLSVSMHKGTGIVTSVPSDAPDDYIALRDLQLDEKLRLEHNVKKEWCDFDVVEIIEIPGMGRRAAVDACTARGIKSAKDTTKLAEAKDEVYKKGFYEGLMLVGAHKGTKVCDAKNLVKQELISAGAAFTYSEPDSKVVSRSGCECVVALCEQWYIDYGEESWRGAVEPYVKDEFDAYTKRCHNQFMHVMSWLGPWACSRHYGLGSYLPWEAERGNKVVIESLSDSTVYMAYYAICHFLHSDLNGDEQGAFAIAVEDLTDDVFNYVFMQTDVLPESSKIPHDRLNAMRVEFSQWYPMSLRVSGKDLIFNHLTMCLYNHAAMWPDKPHLWPKSFFCNGHVLVDNAKMAKSEGNFIGLMDGIKSFSADAMRVGLADAGDGLDDANFRLETAKSAIMRLHQMQQFAEEFVKEKTAGNMRTGEKMQRDLMFENALHCLSIEAKKAYERITFRNGLKLVFYDYSLVRDHYRVLCGSQWSGMHQDCLQLFVETQLLMLSPIAPHLCGWMWLHTLQKPQLIDKELWPEFPNAYDPILYSKLLYIQDFVDECRKTCDKSFKVAKGAKKATDDPVPEKKKCVMVYLTEKYQDWQSAVLSKLQALPVDESGKQLVDPKSYVQALKNVPELLALDKKKHLEAMSFASYRVTHELAARGTEAFALNQPFDAHAFLQSELEYLKRSLCLDVIILQKSEEGSHPNDTSARKSAATPLKPAFFCWTE